MAERTYDPATDGDLLKPDQVMIKLQVSEAALAKWRQRRKGPDWIKLMEGRSGPIRYPERWLYDWIAAQRGSAA